MGAIHPDREYIAVYGSLMRVRGALKLAGAKDKPKLVGFCKIPGLLYDLGEFPGLVAGEGDVSGELYEVHQSRVRA